MGGLGSGGRRPNAGRKKLPAYLKLAHGTATEADRRSARAARQKAAAEPPVETFGPPETLTDAERAIWLRQAPHAFQARTLVRASALAFERYCRVAALEASEARSSGMGGPNHRGLLRQLSVYEQQFCLLPGGPLPDSSEADGAEDDDDEKFFNGGS